MAATSSSDTRVHGVCITGLERSYPEFSRNVHYSLSNFYSGWRGVDGGGDDATAALPLEQSVAFFGVRPRNDSWATVRTDLPALAGESIQTPCGLGRAPWFSAWAKTTTQKVTYGFSFIQMMCDLRACHELVLAHERRVDLQRQAHSERARRIGGHLPRRHEHTHERCRDAAVADVERAVGIHDARRVEQRRGRRAILRRERLARLEPRHAG